MILNTGPNTVSDSVSDSATTTSYAPTNSTVTARSGTDHLLATSNQTSAFRHSILTDLLSSHSSVSKRLILYHQS